jgi:DNA-binding transcriptional MerR regulator
VALPEASGDESVKHDEMAVALTIDELAAATTGSTTRTIRSFQTSGLVDHPDLRGRTGVYRARHLEQLRAVLHLQSQGFSLRSVAILFAAHRRGETLGAVLGLPEGARAIRPVRPVTEPGADAAELYGFGELQRNRTARRGRPSSRPRCGTRRQPPDHAVRSRPVRSWHLACSP